MTTRIEMKIINILKVRSKKQLGEIENRLGGWKFTTQVCKRQYIAEEEVKYLSSLIKSFDNHDDIFDRQKLLVRPYVCLLQRVQGQRLQSWWGGNTKGEIST